MLSLFFILLPVILKHMTGKEAAEVIDRDEM